MAYHLGPGAQSNTITQGYCQEVEDKLLESIDWQSNGYDLFTISEMASSSSSGMFEPQSESNSLVISKIFWQENGGFEERFLEVGGGLANLDLYKRIFDHESSKIYRILGWGGRRCFSR